MKRAIALIAALTLLAPVAFAQMHMGMGQGQNMINRDSSQIPMMGKGMMSGSMMGSGMMMGAMMGNGMMHPLAALEKLGLSDKQIGKIIDLQADQLKEGLSISRKMSNTWQSLAELQQADSPDYGKIEAQMIELAKDRTAMMKLTRQTEEKALKVLTDEQRETLGDNPLPLPFGCHMNGNGMMGGMMSGGMMGGMMQRGMHGQTMSSPGMSHDTQK